MRTVAPRTSRAGSGDSIEVALSTSATCDTVQASTRSWDEGALVAGSCWAIAMIEACSKIYKYFRLPLDCKTTWRPLHCGMISTRTYKQDNQIGAHGALEQPPRMTPSVRGSVIRSISGRDYRIQIARNQSDQAPFSTCFPLMRSCSCFAVTRQSRATTFGHYLMTTRPSNLRQQLNAGQVAALGDRNEVSHRSGTEQRQGLSCQGTLRCLTRHHHKLLTLTASLLSERRIALSPSPLG